MIGLVYKMLKKKKKKKEKCSSQYLKDQSNAFKSLPMSNWKSKTQKRIVLKVANSFEKLESANVWHFCD